VKLLIISEQYLPSIRSGSILINDLIKKSISRNHNITLITSTLNIKKKPEKKISNLNIIRLKTFSYNKNNFILKGLNQISFFFKVLFLSILKRKKFDKIFIYSPPLFLGLIYLFLTKPKKIINVQDIFPQNAIDLGILKNSVLIFLLRFIEKVIYKNSDKIIVNSYNAQKYLINKHPKLKNKIIFNFNWSKNNKIKGRIKRKKNKIFKFIFGGSIGPSQDLRKILDVFKYYDNKCELHIFGQGLSLKNLKKDIYKKKIRNIKIFKPISNDKFSKILKNYDSALITLNNKNKTPFIPGKFNFYCANKKSVTAIVHNKCDLRYIIRNNNLGFVTSKYDYKSLTHFFKKIINSKQLTKLDTNAHTFARKNFEVLSIVRKIEKI
jgi:hypothetical protein